MSCLSFFELRWVSKQLHLNFAGMTVFSAVVFAFLLHRKSSCKTWKVLLARRKISLFAVSKYPASTLQIYSWTCFCDESLVDWKTGEISLPLRIFHQWQCLLHILVNKLRFHSSFNGCLQIVCKQSHADWSTFSLSQKYGVPANILNFLIRGVFLK